MVEKITLPKECQPYFYLFEIVDGQFGKKFLGERICHRLSIIDLERKLRPHEYPFEIHVQNSRTAKTTCLSFRKFLFSPSIENVLLKYPTVRDYLYREVSYSSHSLHLIHVVSSRLLMNSVAQLTHHRLMKSHASNTLKPSPKFTIPSLFLFVHVVLVKIMVMLFHH